MWSKRQEVDYALQRRNTLRTLQGPQRAFARAAACDADPPLVRAALHHGEPHPVDCPVCGRSQMVVLNHVFGEQLGQRVQGVRRGGLSRVRLEPHDQELPVG